MAALQIDPPVGNPLTLAIPLQPTSTGISTLPCAGMEATAKVSDGESESLALSVMLTDLSACMLALADCAMGGAPAPQPVETLASAASPAHTTASAIILPIPTRRTPSEEGSSFSGNT